MTFNNRELAEKLSKVPDTEIEQYHNNRVKEARRYYFYAAICGICAIPVFIFEILWLGIILGVFGLGLVQTGRFKREKWKRTYHYLMYHRGTQIQKNQENEEATKNQGSKYKNAKNKLRKADSSK